MSRTNLPTDKFVNELERQLAAAADPQAGLESALKKVLACTGAGAGLAALQLPGEGKARLLAFTGLPLATIDAQNLAHELSHGIILTLQGWPPKQLFRRRVAAALPLTSTRGHQGALVLLGQKPLQNVDCLYAAAAALGSWAEGERRGPVPPDLTLLLRSRNTLRALFDNLPLSLYIIDCDYNLIALNKSRADRAHIRLNEAVGAKCYRALFGRSSPCVGCRAQESLQAGVSTNRLGRQGEKRSGVSEWDISTYPIPGGPAGEALQAIVMEMDVTEKKLLEASLVQSEKMAAVGQLAAGVAHEINNPLAAIIANTEILKRDLPAEEPVQEALELIHLAGSRAADVVSALLGFSRREEYQFQRLDINENIQKSVLLVQHEAEKRGATLSLDLARRLPRIQASSSHLQGIWTNLVLNALDAPGAAALEIKISTRRMDDGVLIVVCDNGKGISPEDRERIFEPFYTTKGPGTGTGLGLSICQRVVRHHGGTIEVESQPGEGSCFTIYLPKVPPEKAKAGK